jgi:hypothetical protein
VSQQCKAVLVIAARFKGECTLADLRHHELGVKVVINTAAQAQTLEGCGCDNHAGNAVFAYTIKATRHVAAQLNKFKIGPQSMQQRLAPRSTRGYASSEGKLFQGRAHKGVARIKPFRHGCEHETLNGVSGEILG